MSIKELFLGRGWSEEAAQFFEERKDHPDVLRIAKRLGAAVTVPSPPKTPKATIPHGLRWEVWLRDNFTCRRCGTRRDLSVDHIVPESKGGVLQLTNLQTLCKRCNSAKGAR